MKRFIAILGAALLSAAAVEASETINLKKTPIVVDSTDAELVRTAAGLLAGDIERVSGIRPAVGPACRASTAIIAGTLGESPIVDALAESGKIDVEGIRGKWECYHMEVVKYPIKGISRALVIVGSNRRGTAYGILSISKKLGVSPWYWWLDLPVVKNSNPVYTLDSPITSKEPSVKYRGIFINDEDFGLNQWAKLGIDKDYNSIGPNTYDKVCELLIRLNANLLYPAMHRGTVAFYQIPENKVVADKYGIVISTSHHEPLNFNPATEWKNKKHGEWNYDKNPGMMDKMMRERVRECAQYENVYTIALRGAHDIAMNGSDNMADRINTMDRALRSQRQILESECGKPIDEIPQCFTPYKEVLTIYNAGLKIPEDVTLIWPDDNYGYMKRVSNPEEQKRKGGSGCYYHISYNGKPHGYLWFGSTPANLMYTELSKVYNTGGNRLWVVNVGDIKGCEMSMDQFLAMAYDWESFNLGNAWKYPYEWFGCIFGSKIAGELSDIYSSFNNLAFIRKPELMGWGWDYNMELKEKCSDTEFSRTSYKEMSRRLVEYDRISAKADSLLATIPESLRTAFFHTVCYPVVGSMVMNRIHLLAQTNREYAAQGRISTAKVADEVRMWRDSLERLTARYNEGKWNAVMSITQIKKTSYCDMPVLFETEQVQGAPYGIEVEGGGLSEFNVLPRFNSFCADRSYSFSVYSRRDCTIAPQVVSNPEWVRVTQTEDRFGDSVFDVSIDWSLIPEGTTAKGQIMVSVCGEKEPVLVSARRLSAVPEDVSGIEDNGVVSIAAESFSRFTEADGIKVHVLENLGCEGRSVMLGDGMDKPLALLPTSTNLEYDFWCESRGMVDVYCYILPTFELFNALPPFEHEVQPRWTRYGVMIDNGQIVHPTFSAPEYSGEWYVNVARNCCIRKSTLYVDKAGKHTLRFVCGTPGVVLHKVVIDFGGMKRSYMGPEPTKPGRSSTCLPSQEA